jgi:hypothetical protein
LAKIAENCDHNIDPRIGAHANFFCAKLLKESFHLVPKIFVGEDGNGEEEGEREDLKN